MRRARSFGNKYLRTSSDVRTAAVLQAQLQGQIGPIHEPLPQVAIRSHGADSPRSLQTSCTLAHGDSKLLARVSQGFNPHFEDTALERSTATSFHVEDNVSSICFFQRPTIYWINWVYTILRSISSSRRSMRQYQRPMKTLMSRNRRQLKHSTSQLLRTVYQW